jgi:hypothetical protein
VELNELAVSLRAEYLVPSTEYGVIHDANRTHCGIRGCLVVCHAFNRRRADGFEIEDDFRRWLSESRNKLDAPPETIGEMVRR